jgi:hypothetical protein
MEAPDLTPATCNSEADRVAQRLLHLQPRPFLPRPYPHSLLMSPHAHAIIADFRWEDYFAWYPDVAAKVDGPEAARRHFVYSGYVEGRLHNARIARFLNPAFYRARYPELLLDSDAAALRHYCYAGYYERRIPNADTEYLCAADLHIFQLGKVGSNAIARQLEGHHQGKVLHLHWLTDLALAYSQCPLSYAEVLHWQKPVRLRVISAVREVVSRVVAGYLEFLDSIEGCGPEEMAAEKVLEDINVSFWSDADNILRWFDHAYFCGLDVYASPFSHETGHVVIEHPQLSLFLYRQENLQGLDGALGQFLGLDEFRLGRDNTGAQKKYAAAYAALQQRFVVPEEVLDALYASAYMRHFYSDAERARFHNYWRKPRE